jgi:malate synthase
MTDRTRTYAEGIELTAEVPEEFAGILTPEAVAFVAKLSREYRGRVHDLLAKRAERPARCRISCRRRGRSGRATGR